MAYDLTGNQKLVIRGGGGLFYDRPDGNTVFSIPGNPPIATPRTCATGSCSRRSGTGLSPQPVPATGYLPVRREGAGVLAVAGGVQKSLPWAMRRSTSRTSATTATTAWAASRAARRQPERGGLRRCLSAAEPGPDADQHVPGDNTHHDNLLCRIRGLGNINQNTTEFWDTYHSHPDVAEPPVP